MRITGLTSLTKFTGLTDLTKFTGPGSLTKTRLASLTRSPGFKNFTKATKYCYPALRDNFPFHGTSYPASDGKLASQ